MCANCDFCKGNVNKLLFIFMKQIIVLWLVGCISWLHVIIFQSASSHISFSIYFIHNVAMRGQSAILGQTPPALVIKPWCSDHTSCKRLWLSKALACIPFSSRLKHGGWHACQSNIMTLSSLLSVPVAPGSCFIMQLKRSSCVSHHLKDKHTYNMWKNRRHSESVLVVCVWFSVTHEENIMAFMIRMPGSDLIVYASCIHVDTNQFKSIIC